MKSIATVRHRVDRASIGLRDATIGTRHRAHTIVGRRGRLRVTILTALGRRDVIARNDSARRVIATSSSALRRTLGATVVATNASLAVRGTLDRRLGEIMALDHLLRRRAITRAGISVRRPRHAVGKVVGETLPTGTMTAAARRATRMTAAARRAVARGATCRRHPITWHNTVLAPTGTMIDPARRRGLADIVPMVRRVAGTTTSVAARRELARAGPMDLGMAGTTTSGVSLHRRDTIAMSGSDLRREAKTVLDPRRDGVRVAPMDLRVATTTSAGDLLREIVKVASDQLPGATMTLVLRPVRAAVARMGLRVATMMSVAARRRELVKVGLTVRRTAGMMTSAVVLHRAVAKAASDRRRVRVAIAQMDLHVATTMSAAARRANDVALMGQAAGLTISAAPAATMVHLPAVRPDHRRVVRALPRTMRSLL